MSEENEDIAYVTSDSGDTGDAAELTARYEEGITENGVTLLKAQIDNFTVDAIVCPWVDTAPERGHFCRRICAAAGPEMLTELDSIWPDRNPPGVSILTGSHGIKTCQHIIHVREPNPTIENSTDRTYWSPWKLQSLKGCIKASLIMAVSLDCQSIAFPPIGIRNSYWPPKIAAQAVLTVVGEFRAGHFQDRIPDIYFLFDNLDDPTDELKPYRHARQLALEWIDPYKLPYLLQSGNKYEPDQRVSEKSDTDSEDSKRQLDDNSGRESYHLSDIEPSPVDFPPGTPARILREGESGFPVPLGVYVQFENLVLPEIPELMDQHQPAVYGYMRRRRGIYVRKEYDGLEVNVRGSGMEGRWIIALQISNHTQDGRLIGRPLDRRPGIKFTDPKLRLRPDYRLILNPDSPLMRQHMIAKYLRDVKQHNFDAAKERHLRRQQEGLKARRYRRTIRRRWRHLRARRRRNAQHKWDVYELQRERVHARRENGEEVASPPRPQSLPESESVPEVKRITPPRRKFRVRMGDMATPVDVSPSRYNEAVEAARRGKNMSSGGGEHGA